MYSNNRYKDTNMLLQPKALIKFVLHVFEHCRSISFRIDIKDEYQSTDRDDFSISHNISQELMLLNVPVNLTIEGYKIELPKSVPIDNRGNCILGTIVLKAFVFLKYKQGSDTNFLK